MLIQQNNAALGSSPLTWRSQCSPNAKASRLRIISTYVEITSHIIWRYYPLQDHLHIRGDHDFKPEVAELKAGSSPLTWRSLFCFGFSLFFLRIISTYVEITKTFVANPINCKDHLHIRGDHTKQSS